MYTVYKCFKESAGVRADIQYIETHAYPATQTVQEWVCVGNTWKTVQLFEKIMHWFEFTRFCVCGTLTIFWNLIAANASNPNS